MAGKTTKVKCVHCGRMIPLDKVSYIKGDRLCSDCIYKRYPKFKKDCGLGRFL